MSDFKSIKDICKSRTFFESLIEEWSDANKAKLKEMLNNLPETNNQGRGE